MCHFCMAHAEALVKFADYEPLPDGMCGHPRGLEWFCAKHLAAAKALSGVACEEAMSKMPRRWFS